MQQYWAIKQDNFDKVIFFKLGKFYELFYEDALVGHRHLELNWMGRKMYIFYKSIQGILGSPKNVSRNMLNYSLIRDLR
jgi:DNA mismatch repair ATPase MutS